MTWREQNAAMELAQFESFGEEATYTPSGGSGVTVRVILNQSPGVDQIFFDAGALRSTEPRQEMEFRKSELEALGLGIPAPGATVLLGSISYRVDGPPTVDDSFYYRVPVKKVSS